MTTTATAQDLQHAPGPTGGARRLLLGPGLLRGAWMFVLFGGIGFGIVVLIRWGAGWHPILLTLLLAVAPSVAGCNAPNSGEGPGGRVQHLALTPEQDAQFWDYVTHAAQFMVNTMEDLSQR